MPKMNKEKRRCLSKYEKFKCHLLHAFFMELFLEVLHVYIKNLVPFLVIMVAIFAGYSRFEWLKLTHMTNCA